MTFEQYLELEGVNWSTLKHFYKSPAHVKVYLDSPREETPSMAKGTLQHMAILEPDKFTESVAVMPDFGDLRFKESKEKKKAWIDDHQGLIPCDAKTYSDLFGMSKAIWANSDAKALLTCCTETERPLQWSEGPVKCKGLLDIVTSKGIIADIKTTDDVRPFSFAKKAAAMHYYEQAAYYLRGARAAKLPLDRFLWIAIESSAPYSVRVYSLKESDRIAADNVLDSFLAKYWACKETDKWPGYQAGIEELECPDWHLSKMESNY